MRATSKAALAKWAEEALLSKKAKQLRIVVRPGAKGAEAEEEDDGAELIDDPEGYAASRPPHARAERPLPKMV